VSRGSPIALTNLAMLSGPFSESTRQMSPAISPIFATQETGEAVAIGSPHFRPKNLADWATKND
jgi:hypothetical protein